MRVQIQSNSIRGEYLDTIKDLTMNEILASASTLLGPGATDAFIDKDGQNYYTRDGKEYIESMIFDNEVANRVHHTLFQAVYNQGRNAGDGSTSLAVFYCWIYKLLREQSEAYPTIYHTNINYVRYIWRKVVESIVDGLKEKVVPLDESNLLAMLYTCTQDVELATKIFDELKDPILAGAYIIPRKSNINTDFNVTIHNRPTYKVTVHYALRDLLIQTQGGKVLQSPDLDNCVVYFCNGPIDITHDELFAGITQAGCPDPFAPPEANKIIHPTVILLGSGLTEKTREAIRTFNSFIVKSKVNTKEMSNLVIMTLNDHHGMTPDEIEDLGTVLTNYPGLGGMVQPITFETYLYRLFLNDAARAQLGLEPIQLLEEFDADTSIIQQMGYMYSHPFKVIYDEQEGIALDMELGTFAKQRYEDLRKQIAEEKSPVKKVELNKRLRRSFGMFIDLEVGSVLLKDSQRKFELILDAVISTAEAAKDGILYGNSMLHVIDILCKQTLSFSSQSDVTNTNLTYEICSLIKDALCETVATLVRNYAPSMANSIDAKYIAKRIIDGRRPEDFNLLGIDVWPVHELRQPLETLSHTITYPDGKSKNYVFAPFIAESYNAIKEIVENSITPVEMALMKQMTVSDRSFRSMGNYVGE